MYLSVHKKTLVTWKIKLFDSVNQMVIHCLLANVCSFSGKVYADIICSYSYKTFL